MKLFLLMLMICSIGLTSAQEILPTQDPTIPCEVWGTYIFNEQDWSKTGICKIRPEMIGSFFATQVSEEQKEILYKEYPVEYYCVTKTLSKNDIQRSANFHLRPHENSPILAKYGLPYDTRLERLEFIKKPEGSQYNWVKVRYEQEGKNVVGYVARHTVWCNRVDEEAN